jgi:hypothetical protein
MMLVRDEGDIIAQTLAHLLTWCDEIHIVDLGSADDTWDIVHDFSHRDRRVRAIMREDCVYHRGLRVWLYDYCRSRFHRGDWLCRADADEFYHVAPPDFITANLTRGESRIVTAHYDFHMTRAELRAWNEGRETLADRSAPIELRRRHFLYVNHPERRLWRYRPGMRWESGLCDPPCAGLIAAARLPVRHYPSRDPEQLRTRLSLRARAHAAGHIVGHHWSENDWHAFVIDETKPRVRIWPIGEALPITKRPPIVPTDWRRLAQRAFYATPLVNAYDTIRAARVPRLSHRSPSDCLAEIHPANTPVPINIEPASATSSADHDAVSVG